jgi:hypothetical protein
MGSFPTQSEPSRGWLATLFCCSARGDAVEHIDLKRPISTQASPSHGETSSSSITKVIVKQLLTLVFLPVYSRAGTTMSYQQTLPEKISLPPYSPNFPFTRPVEDGDEFVRPQDRVRPASASVSISKSLDLDGSSLLSRNHHSWHSRSKTLGIHGKRPSIGQPTNFRHLDYTEPQRRSLVPLKLSPVTLGPSPHSHHALQPSNLEQFPYTGPSHVQRDIWVPDSPHSFLPPTRQTLAASGPDFPSMRHTFLEGFKPPKLPISSYSSSSSIRSLRQQAIDNHSSVVSRPNSIVTQSSASSLRSSRRLLPETSNTPLPTRTLPRLHKKRSSQSARKSTAEEFDLEIDREILELNTIVEERRAEAARAQLQDDKHIPAVAPRLAGRARSETLNDIGSALSRPLLAGSLPVSMTNRLSRPFTSVPEPYERPMSSQSDPRSSSRISGWLHNVLPSPSAASEPSGTTTAAATNHQRMASDMSLLTTGSSANSPSLTNASSSHTNGHSRTHTADYRFPPLSPLMLIPALASMEKAVPVKRAGECDFAPLERRMSVGVAL